MDGLANQLRCCSVVVPKTKTVTCRKPARPESRKNKLFSPAVIPSPSSGVDSRCFPAFAEYTPCIGVVEKSKYT